MTNSQDNNERTGLEIAVIGMSGRFPGAGDIEEFWNNLENGIESITRFSEGELIDAGVDIQSLRTPGYVKAKGILNDVEYFDAEFFGYIPGDAEKMNPQTRLFHQCAWHALEDAGYSPYRYDGLIGLFAGGSSSSAWETINLLPQNQGTGDLFQGIQLADKDFLSTRLSYKLNLKGPSVSVQTACSTSLVAVHLACRSLLIGDCHMALAGGVTVTVGRKTGYLHKEGMIFSADGHCRAFDAEATGVVPGEGIGVVVLKSLEEAEADRDHVYAVIKSTASNNDGVRKVGYTAPSIEGQADAIRMALEFGQVDPGTITYIETHGTGTRLGDPVEIEALKIAYRSPGRQACAIGSVKSNLGHLDCAAGITGFIKTVLALRQKKIPPSLHFKSPNPAIDFKNSPFYVNAALAEWNTNGSKRRAGVSAFGIGGTNVHVIVEEAPQKSNKKSHRHSDRHFHLIPLSARTDGALDRMAENLQDHIVKHPKLDMEAAAYTLQMGRSEFSNRSAFVCGGADDAIDILSGQSPEKMFRFNASPQPPSIVFMFPGQGSQYLEMGLDLYRHEAVFRKEMDTCLDIIQRIGGTDMKSILFPAPDRPVEPQSIDSTDIAQPLLFAIEYSLATLIMGWGIKPAAMIGHSIGEYTAACLAGVFSLEDALAMIIARGALMGTIPTGSMLSVPLPEDDLLPIIEGTNCSIAAVNSTARSVVSGPAPEVESIRSTLNHRGVESRPLHTSHAFHSQMMDPILDDFQEVCAQKKLNPPSLPFISNVSGRPIDASEAADPAYWSKHIRATVRFSEGLSTILSWEQHAIFLEVGPGNSLSAFARQHEHWRPGHQAVNLARHPRENAPDDYYLLEKVAQLWIMGAPLDWKAFNWNTPGQRIPLPAYPFEKTYYKSDCHLNGLQLTINGGPGQSPNASGPISIPSWKRTPLPYSRNSAEGSPKPWLFLRPSDDGDRVVPSVVDSLQEKNGRVISVFKGASFKEIDRATFSINPQIPADYRSLVSRLKALDLMPARIVHLWEFQRNSGWGIKAANPEELVEHFQNSQPTGFYSVLFLVEALTANNVSTPISIDIITQNIQEVSGEEPLAPERSTILAAVKTIPQEHPYITCRAIDFNLPDQQEWRIDQTIRQLANELTADTEDTVVAYRGNSRWIPTFETVASEDLVDREPPLKSRGNYIITGGLGKIGLVLAKYLAEHYRANLTLTGRSQLPDRDRWDTWPVDHTPENEISRKIAAIKEIESLGASVLPLAADAGDLEQMRKVFEAAEKRFGTIDGVIHSAGITGGPTFNEAIRLKPEDCRKQFRPKVNGLIVLDHLLEGRHVDFCWITSSISAFLGGLGFSAYAAANIFMDHYTQSRNRTHPATKWTCVDWDDFDDSEIVEHFVSTLSLKETNHLVVSSGASIQERYDKWVKLESLKQDSQDKPAAPTRHAARPPLPFQYIAPRNKVERTIADSWEDLFGFHPIGVADDFFKLGGDSLKAINNISKINKLLNIHIPLSEFFSRPSIQGLADYISADGETRDHTAVEPVEKKEYYQLSPAQKRLFILHRLAPESTGYNISAAFAVRGDLDTDKLSKSVQAMIARHEILRTSFWEVGDRAVQRIDPEVSLAIVELSQESGQSPDEIIQNFISPFDLSKAPQFRIGLLKQDRHTCILVLDMHHIISDAVSINVFINEIIALYEGLPLPRVSIFYKDYSHWQQSEAQQEFIRKQEDNWLSQQLHTIPKLNLPIDFKRPAVKSFEGNSLTFILEGRETGAIKEKVRQTDTTLFMFLFSAYIILLSKLSGQEEIVAGTPVAGRRHTDLESIIGMFVNMVVLTGAPLRTKRFGEFLQEIKTNTIESFENQEYQFEDLVEKSPLTRDPSRNPLFDTAFVFQNVDIQEIQIPGLAIKPIDFERGISKFDLTFTGHEADGAIVFGVEYSSRLFLQATIESFIRRYKRIISIILEDEDVRLGDIDIITAEEKETILRQFNDSDTGYPKDLSIHQIFESVAAKRPECVATVHNDSHLTYRFLDTGANRLAQTITQKSGAGIAAVMLERSHAQIYSLLAILKAGLGYLPLAPSHPKERINYMLEDSAAGLLIIEEHLLANVNTGIETICPHQDPDGASLRKKRPPANEAGPLSPAYIIYTSGTTGRPKGVLVEHRNVVRLLFNDQFQFDFSGGDIWTMFHSYCFDFSVWEMYGALLYGAKLVLVPAMTTKDPRHYLSLLAQENVTVVNQTPSAFYQLASAAVKNDSPPLAFRYVIFGGEALRPAKLKQWREKYPGTQLINMYGITETTVHVTFAPISAEEIERDICVIGGPIPTLRTYIMDQNGHLLPPGIAGELCVAGAGVARGYLNRPELTAERFAGDPFQEGQRMYRSGDKARFFNDNSGNLEFLGRIDQQIQIRGFRVEPGEIESSLQECDKRISQVVVVDRQQAEGDTFLCAYFVASESLGTSALRQRLTLALPDYMIPSYFTQIDAIPLTPNGKLDRNKLPKLEEAADSAKYRAPETPLQQKMTAIWADILGIAATSIGIDSDFFELGGHSLKANTLALRTQQAFNVKIPLMEIFKNPTIRGLSQYLSSAESQTFSMIPSAEKKEHYRASSAQKRLYLLQQMEPSSTGYNICVLIDIEGDIDKSRLETAFKQLISRHESLRTAFHLENHQPVQRIHEKIEFEIEDAEKEFIRPFDLGRAPLFRVGLTTKGNQKHLLMVDTHHIISDGISQQLLTREFLQLFQGASPLSPVSIQYKDFSEWRNQENQQRSIARHEQYWLDRFQTEAPVLDLPYDFKRPAVQRFEGNRLDFSFDKEDTASLKAAAAAVDVTLFMFLLGILNILLSKLSGQDDIVIGSPVAGRRHPDLLQTIGMFVNTLALRNYPKPEIGLLYFLENIKNNTISAFENQDYHFEDLVEKVITKRDMSRNPLFDVVLAIQNFEDSTSSLRELRMPGLVFRPIAHDTGTSKFDLSLTGSERDGRMVFRVEYSSNLFKPSTIERFIRYFKKITSIVLEKPDIRLGAVDIISSEEKDMILNRFNNTDCDYPKGRFIHGLFEDMVRKQPDHVAVIHHDTNLTYHCLDNKADELADIIRREKNTHSMAAVLLERSLDMIVSLLAILKAGCAYLPLDPGHPKERIDYILADSGAHLVITTQALTATVNTTLKAICLDEERHDGRQIPKSTSPRGSHPFPPAYIIYTSGTTGRPKGVLIEHQNVVRLLFNDNFHFDFSNTDIWTMFHTYCFDVSVWEMYGSLLYGGKLVIVPNMTTKDPRQYLTLLARENVTILNQTPSAFYQLADFEIQNSGPALSLRYIVFAGEALIPAKLKQWRKKYPRAQLINMYGITETTVHSTFTRIGPEEIEGNINNIGRPLPTLRIYVMDKDGHLLPPGIAGEIFVAGAGVARGYLNRPELTAQRFTKDPFRNDERMYRSGDNARFFNDNSGALEFLGRIDQQIQVRGFRVEPGEIESSLQACDERIKQVVVVDRQSDEGDTFLAAYFVASGKPEIPELRRQLAVTLPDYMIPSYFMHIETIPLTANGKLDRRSLPEPDIGRDNQYRAPETLTQQRLVAIWADVLGLKEESVGIETSFFELGGHSLKATIMVSRIQKEFHVHVPLLKIFRSPKINSVAEYIDSAAKVFYEDIFPAEKRDYYPQSSAQKRLFFLDQFEHIGTSYNIPFAFIVSGELDRERFSQTWLAILRRHEILRTSFLLLENQPVQRVGDPADVTLEFEELDTVIPSGPQSIDTLFQEFIRPFDVSRSPLLRIGLAGTASGETIILFDVHHIIADGTSTDILVKEFLHLYGRQPLEEMTIQYKDFSNWQNRLFAREKLRSQWDYWLEMYGGGAELPKLEMPLDYPRPEIMTFEGKTLQFTLPAQEARAFKTLGIQRNATLFMSLLTVVNILLAKYTGQDDMIVGSGIAGRPHADLQQLIGMFVNTLAIRGFPAGEKTFLQLLEEVKLASVKAFENQDVQFEDLIDRLNPERETSRNPLFDVCFIVQNYHRQSVKLSAENVTFKPHDYSIHTAKFDLTIYTWEIGDQIQFSFEYYFRIFKEETIRQFGRHFINIITQVSRLPDIKISDIDILSSAEKTELLLDLNATATGFPKDKTLQDLFQAQVERQPYKTAVTFKHTALTYRCLDEEANRVAHYILEEVPARGAKNIGILMDRGPQLIVAILGILKAGGAYVPFDPQFPETRIKRMIDDTVSPLVISQKKYIKSLNRLQWECRSLTSFLCVDSSNALSEEETEKSGLMAVKLWEYVGETAGDDITGGGWLSSYTGEPISRREMDEYSDNVLRKLTPLLHKEMRVLEIGCATGLTMYRVAPRVGFYFGTDLSGIIIQKNRERIAAEGHQNIQLAQVPAHDIDTIGAGDFDLVIVNSVIQCFHGHNYLRQVIKKAVDLLAPAGSIFVGDVMDQDLKDELIDDLVAFKHSHLDKDYKTKIDWSTELFLSRDFFLDLQTEIPAIIDVSPSPKIYTIENELTKFRYDVLLTIEKNNPTETAPPKHKKQHGKESVALRPASAPKVDGSSTDLAYIIYTSGSTGNAKGTLIEHRNVTRVVKDTNYIDISPADTILQLSNAAFDGSVFDIYGALLNGAKLVMLSKDEVLAVDTLLSLIQREKISVFFITTALFNTLVDMGADALKGVRKLLFGGELVSPDHSRRALQTLGEGTIIHVYGPTETTVYAAYHPIDRIHPTDRTIPIGEPIANTTIFLLDKAMRLVPKGVVGEIYIGGDGLSRGYLNQPELTAETFVPNPFQPESRLYKTGDLGKRRPNGDIEFTGRIDHQVKIRGFRIELGEIENQLLKHEQINEALVVDLVGQTNDKFLCAYVGTGSPETADQMDKSELKEFLSQTLPDFMIPAYIVALPALPLNPNGKIDRKALPDPEREALAPEAAGPRNKIERALASIWAEVLGAPEAAIGIDGDFFEMGGHSLRATILVSKIHTSLDVKIPLAQIFKTPTIRELGTYIQTAAPDKYAPIEPAEKKEYYPLSSAQKRLYIINQIECRSTAYNMTGVWRLQGNVDSKGIGKIFFSIIDKHETLRTSLFMLRGTPVQKIHETITPELELHDIRQEKISEKTAVIRRIIGGFVRPFDLSRPPLIRIGLIQAEDNEYILMLDMHHIISDGTSLGILAKEFMALYNGEKPEPLDTQYKDYCLWQMTEENLNVAQQQEKYWREQFAGELPVLDIPTDFQRPAVMDFAGDTIHFNLDEALTSQLKNLAASREVTLFMLLTAAFNVWMAKLGGLEDIIVGTPVAGRRHEDLAPMIGMFVNMLALRHFPKSELPFLDFLDTVKSTTLDAFENQEYQFEELVEMIKVERNPGRNPVFDVVFALQNIDLPALKIPELTLSPYPGETGTAPFDVTTHCFESGATLQFRLEYRTSLFKRESIERFAGYFQRIIRSICTTPAALIADIDMIPENQRHEILETFNGTATQYPADKTIDQLFLSQVERSPNAIAVSFSDRQLTYKALDAETDAISATILAKDAASKEIIAIVSDKSIEMVIAALAILKAGGAYLPLNTGNPAARNRYMLNDCGVELILAQTKYSDKFPPDYTIIDIESAIGQEKAKPSGLTPLNSPNSIAYTIYTSGSTGGAKGVLVTHKNVVRLVKNTNYIEVSPHDNILQTGAFDFDASTFEIWGALLNGATLCVISKETLINPHLLKASLFNSHVTTMFMTSPLFYQILQADIEIFRPLNILFVGGEVLNIEHAETLRNHYPELNFINCYGPTENTTFSTTYPITHISRFRVPIGKSIANTTAYIVDKNDTLQPVGIPGELCLGGDGVAVGYLNNPELTKTKFIPNPFKPGDTMYRTGDIARWLPDGSLDFIGRIDFQVKIRGFRIEPGEVEDCISNHPDIVEAVVTVIQETSGAKALCCYFTSGKQLDIADLKTAMADMVPPHMIPSYFVQLERFPLKPNGKIDRKALPKPEATSGSEFQAPGNELEKQIALVWQEVLQLNTVGIHDNFFDLGGNSINVIQLASKLNVALAKEIPVVSLFTYPTIDALANHILREKTPESHDAKESRWIETMSKSKEKTKDRRQRRKAIKKNATTIE
jgi:amino acid adenylation domain-containing protein